MRSERNRLQAQARRAAASTAAPGAQPQPLAPLTAESFDNRAPAGNALPKPLTPGTTTSVSVAGVSSGGDAAYVAASGAPRKRALPFLSPPSSHGAAFPAVTSAPSASKRRLPASITSGAGAGIAATLLPPLRFGGEVLYCRSLAETDEAVQRLEKALEASLEAQRRARGRAASVAGAAMSAAGSAGATALGAQPPSPLAGSGSAVGGAARGEAAALGFDIEWRVTYEAGKAPRPVATVQLAAAVPLPPLSVASSSLSLSSSSSPPPVTRGTEICAVFQTSEFPAGGSRTLPEYISQQARCSPLYLSLALPHSCMACVRSVSQAPCQLAWRRCSAILRSSRSASGPREMPSRFGCGRVRRGAVLPASLSLSLALAQRDFKSQSLSKRWHLYHYPLLAGCCVPRCQRAHAAAWNVRNACVTRA